MIVNPVVVGDGGEDKAELVTVQMVSGVTAYSNDGTSYDGVASYKTRKGYISAARARMPNVVVSGSDVTTLIGGSGYNYVVFIPNSDCSLFRL